MPAAGPFFHRMGRGRRTGRIVLHHKGRHQFPGIFRCTAVHLRGSIHNPLELAVGTQPLLLVKGAQRARKLSGIGDYIALFPRMEGAYPQRYRLGRINAGGPEHAQIGQDLGAAHNRVMAEVGPGDMPAFAVQAHGVGGQAGHPGAGIHADLAGIQPRVHMDGPGGVHLIPGQRVQHGLHAFAGFLRLFKAEQHRSVQTAAGSAQHLHGGQQHCHMGVVPAGVGYPGRAGNRRLGTAQVFRRLLHRQRVHIRPQQHGFARAAFQAADQAVFPHTFPGNAQLIHPAADKRAGFLFRQAQFRVLVQPVTVPDRFRGNLVQKRPQFSFHLLPLSSARRPDVPAPFSNWPGCSRC